MDKGSSLWGSTLLCHSSDPATQLPEVTMWTCVQFKNFLSLHFNWEKYSCWEKQNKKLSMFRLYTPGTNTCYQTWAWVCRSSQQPCFTNTSDKVPQASVQTLIKWLKIIILGKNELQGNPFWHKKNDTMELGRWMDRDCTVREKNTNTEGITVIDEVQTMTTARKAWEA